MANKPDGLGLGYSYEFPSAGVGLRIKNALSQFSDLFSEFNRYIAPAYHHDRCERSVYMRLYSMHKREFVMVFLAFFACFGLGIFIGLAGPPITVTKEYSGLKILANNTNSIIHADLSKGPFIMHTPEFGTYNQQLWLIAQVTTKNSEDEVFDKVFHISVSIDGLNEDHTATSILKKHNKNNRTRHLHCNGHHCDEFVVLHLGFLAYSHYSISVSFYGLEGLHQRYTFQDVKFYFKTYNPAFTQIEIWFRLFFLIGAFMVTCFFAHSLRQYPINDWSMEQKWVSILLPLLLLYNNPMFPLTFLVDSWLPGMMDALFQATFLCALLLFWLCIYHGLRQNERTLLGFYTPKLIVIIPLWLCAVVLSAWQKCDEKQDPTYNHIVDADNYYGFKVFFFINGVIYLIYLLTLILKAYSELRSMPFFDMRLRFLTLLMICVASVITAEVCMKFAPGPVVDEFVSALNAHYDSSAHFMALYGLLNFYTYSMAYVYAPLDRPPHEAPLTKDNPAFSMVTESDEEVLFGSDDEQQARRPLNSQRGDYDSD